jgi:hypothetical protein
MTTAPPAANDAKPPPAVSTTQPDDASELSSPSRAGHVREIVVERSVMSTERSVYTKTREKVLAIRVSCYRDLSPSFRARQPFFTVPLSSIMTKSADGSYEFERE